MNYTCHSGGCPGSDMTWEIVGEEYGVKTIAYSFQGHTQYGKNQKILSVTELEEGFEAVLRANKVLKKHPQGQPTYVKNLLARNWFQVKNSASVFAIAKSMTDKSVEGGTGWAVQMAIDCDKPVYVFDQESNLWTEFIYPLGCFVPTAYRDMPNLPENFAGIGTREIKDNGIEAIQKIFETSFGVVA